MEIHLAFDGGTILVTGEPGILALSEQLKLEEADFHGLPPSHRFRNMPLPDEIVPLADQALRDKT